MYGEYTRNRILTLSNANKTPTEIVSVLREENIVIVRTTVARIIRRTREKKEGEQHQDPHGRPLKASSPMKRKIDAVYRQNPEVTASELKNILENELTGIRIGVSMIKRARKAAGWDLYSDTILSNGQRSKQDQAFGIFPEDNRNKRRFRQHYIH